MTCSPSPPAEELSLGERKLLFYSKQKGLVAEERAMDSDTWEKQKKGLSPRKKTGEKCGSERAAESSSQASRWKAVHQRKTKTTGGSCEGHKGLECP